MSEENNDVHGFIRFLREKAEERLNTPEPSRISANPQRASRRLRHELQVHQVELELQNEELRRIQAELEKSRRSYMDLYHHAPEGYIVLNAAGIIVEAPMLELFELEYVLPCSRTKMVKVSPPSL